MSVENTPELLLFKAGSGNYNNNITDMRIREDSPTLAVIEIMCVNIPWK